MGSFFFFAWAGEYLIYYRGLSTIRGNHHFKEKSKKKVPWAVVYQNDGLRWISPGFTVGDARTVVEPLVRAAVRSAGFVVYDVPVPRGSESCQFAAIADQLRQARPACQPTCHHVRKDIAAGLESRYDELHHFLPDKTVPTPRRGRAGVRGTPLVHMRVMNLLYEEHQGCTDVASALWAVGVHCGTSRLVVRVRRC